MNSYQESREIHSLARLKESVSLEITLIPMESTQAEADAKLKVIFLIFPSKAHINRAVDTARVFAMHDADVTIITTTVTATIFQNSIDRDSARGRSIRTHVVKFPSAQVGIPEGIEIFTADTGLEMAKKFVEGFSLLQGEIEQLFEDLKADCIATDMLYPWTADVAAKLGIPRLLVHGGSYFARCAEHSIENYAPHKGIESDIDKFTLPGLPHHLEMTRLQIPERYRAPNEITYLMETVRDSEKRSYGSLFNSFYEMEGAYQEHYERVIGTKTWGLGPVSLWANQDASDKAARGSAKAEQDDGWLEWLNSKPESSVLYVGFGSLIKFPSSQLIEIALALEDSGHDFMWVVKKKEEDEDGGGSFLQEFEKRVKASSKGYLIWGWAPQLLILDNPAIGGIVTHCGWNTIIESVNAGLPMVTWPQFAEQFFNEKLVSEVLKIGVAVGAKEWRQWDDFGKEVVKKEDIGGAIALLMGRGEESAEMRRRARELSDAAKRAIEAGGSSRTNMLELAEELKSFKLQRVNRK